MCLDVYKISYTISLTHQVPVVWNLAQPQSAGPRYIRGPLHDILVLYLNANR